MSTDARTSNFDSSIKPTRKPKPKNVNPIEAAIKSWLDVLPEELVHSLELTFERLLLKSPKRWVVYPPMILLPSGSFREGSLHPSVPQRQKDGLWKEILERIGKKEGKGILTHLAINSGIPLNRNEDGENILRTPSGLIMLYGDFGPNLQPERAPSERDFEEAFWVSTKQNGITQVWAPRYTMFSRGNVKEKARLLDFHSPEQEMGNRRVGKEELAGKVAVDLYAGIGYFVFSYVKMGMLRVVGWELNPWSVEGLRRGAVANGWSVRVVKGDEGWEGDAKEKIVVFLEDNRRAVERLMVVERAEFGSVSHVNGGLLPNSEASWKMSLEILNGEGWLHLHENVGVNDVERRRVEIEDKFRAWLQEKDGNRQVKVEHVEFVKTFAPGVWHCVFDIYISSH